MATKNHKFMNIHTELEKAELKTAKSVWKRKMKKLYSDFTPKKWAMTSYRVKHPQTF